MARLSRKVRDLALIILGLAIYYAVILPLLLPVTDSVVNVLAAHNLTQVVIPQKVYENVNGTWTWIDKPVVIDIAGIIHLVTVLVLAVAPLAIGLSFLRGW